MEGLHHQQGSHKLQQHHANGTTTMVVASLTALAIGGSLIGLMGFTFLASLTLLIFSSPLLFIFSPLLFFAAFVIVASLVGFAAAAAMALTGVSALGWIYHEVGEHRLMGFGSIDDKVGGRVNDQWRLSM